MKITITFIFPTDPGIVFSKEAYAICLPYETNENPQKWSKRTIEVIGFATKDFSGSVADRMKVAEMEVYSHATCNDKIDTLLKENKECKFIYKVLGN